MYLYITFIIGSECVLIVVLFHQFYVSWCPMLIPQACGVQAFLVLFLKPIFIALIHPIQWTIANPVGADQPAKRQKKTSCVSTGRPVPSTSALARWRVVLRSYLDSMTS